MTSAKSGSPAKTDFLLISGICLSWLLLSIHPLWKYLSHSEAVIAIVVGLVAITGILFVLKRLNDRGRQIHWGWLVLTFGILLIAFFSLYPLSLRHTLNIGSDREDAIRVAELAVQQHRFPYDSRTYLGNPITPLPGALYLAKPFFEIGHVAWQNLLWFALFFAFTARFFSYRATALVYLSVFLLFAPSNLSDFTSGGDYVTNFIYVAIAVASCAWALQRPLWTTVIAALFLGLALSSRVVYVIVLPPLAALFVQRTSLSRTMTLVLTILLTATVVTLPTFSPHPVTHFAMQLNHQAGKLGNLPTALHSRIILPLLALIIACSGFFVRMNLPRIFLVFSLAGMVMFGPAVAAGAIRLGRPTLDFSYLSACLLPFVLWALKAYEGNSLALREAAVGRPVRGRPR